MDDAFAFWTKHIALDAYKLVRRLLGPACIRIGNDELCGHHCMMVDYNPHFDLASVVKQLRKELDAIGWLFVTTGRDKTYPTFAVAPILSRTLTVAYHATRSCLIPTIRKEGLLPSNAERQASNYPDTKGVIHVCEKLTHVGEENDSAEWWLKILSQKNKFNDPNWGIVRVDMTHLPLETRVYQDMHSTSGVVVDRIDRIPGELVSEVQDPDEGLNHEKNGAGMSSGRLEAFSDGVLAIIITIMVLDLKAPREADLDALTPLVPALLSYVLSFVFIGIYWNNHHHLFQAARRVNGRVLWANLHLLFWLSLTPFVTHWMGVTDFAAWPVAAYGTVLLLSGCAYYLLTRALIAQHGRDSVLARAVGGDVKGKVSLLIYAAAVPLAFVHAYLACGLYVVVAVMWLIPDRRIESTLTEHTP